MMTEKLLAILGYKLKAIFVDRSAAFASLQIIIKAKIL